jgi:hypothetical protein
VVVSLDGSARPPGGFFLSSPWSQPPNARRPDGQPLVWQGGELHIRELPVEILIEPATEPDRDAG